MNLRTMLFRLSVATALVTGMTHRASAQVEPAWNTGVRYSYDGAGNIYEIGTDTFKYDAVGRLVESKANGIQRNYAYDRYGNRTDCTHTPGTPSESDCQYGYTINAATNRIAGVTYDDAGNLHKIGGHTYTYDAVNALTRDDVGATPREYVYDANGERIAIYEVNAGKWRWTFRDPSGKVLREFTSTGNGTANWKWTKDYIWRDGLLLATRQIEPGKTTAVTYHYHLDHLGTPRRITDDADRIVGSHSYHAFGPEVSGGLNEPALSVMKLTGHERDTNGLDSWDTLDYMHARYYNGALARFLSVDPANSAKPSMPQTWNRYAYARNNPMRFLDPDGRSERDVIVIPVNVVVSEGSHNMGGITMNQMVDRNITYARDFFNNAGIALKVTRFEASLTPDRFHYSLSGPVFTSQGQIPIQTFARKTTGKELTLVFSGTANIGSSTDGNLKPASFGVHISEDNAAHEIAHQLGNAPDVSMDPFSILNAGADTIFAFETLQLNLGIGFSSTFEGWLRNMASKIDCPRSPDCGTLYTPEP